MKKALKNLPIIFLLIFIGSCANQNGFIQKRKYQKGYHVSLKKRVKPLEKTTINDNITVEKNNNQTEKQENVGFVAEKFDTQTTFLINEENEVYQSGKSNQELQIIPIKKLKTNHFSSGKSRIKAFIPKVTASKNTAKQSNSSDDDTLILLYILAILIPFVAVGIVTDWDLTAVLINLLLTFLCYIPGVIHAFIKIRDNY